MRLLLSLCSNAFSVSGKMLFPFLTAALLLMSVTSCKKETLATVSSDDLKAASSLSAANAANASTSLPNFGAWISGFTIDQKVNGCQQLQVAYVRDAIILKDFDGKSISVDNYTSKGYKVVLNLIYENLPDKKPTPFPTNM